MGFNTLKIKFYSPSQLCVGGTRNQISTKLLIFVPLSIMIIKQGEQDENSRGH